MCQQSVCGLSGLGHWSGNTMSVLDLADMSSVRTMGCAQRSYNQDLICSIRFAFLRLRNSHCPLPFHSHFSCVFLFYTMDLANIDPDRLSSTERSYMLSLLARMRVSSEEERSLSASQPGALSLATAGPTESAVGVPAETSPLPILSGRFQGLQGALATQPGVQQVQWTMAITSPMESTTRMPSGTRPQHSNPAIASLPETFPPPPLTTPIQHTYQSQRTTRGRLPSIPFAPYGSSAGHPSTPTSSQPFLGLNNLGVSMAAQVNQQRRASAASHLPRQPRLPTRGIRRRGPAIQPPVMQQREDNRTARLQDCISFVGTDASGAIDQHIRLKVKVYPPQVSNSYVMCCPCY